LDFKEPWGSKMRRPLTTCFALSLSIIPASAHDPNGVYDDWFVQQRNKHGTSCCDLSHAHVLKDDDWHIRDKRYQVRVGDRWLNIEDWHLLRRGEPNPTGKAILWFNEIGYEAGGLQIQLFCFTPSQEG
jgi:hypothetical protein